MIAVLFPLKAEARAFLEALPALRSFPTKGDNNRPANRPPAGVAAYLGYVPVRQATAESAAPQEFPAPTIELSVGITGPGKVAAALATQWFIDRFRPGLIVCAGTAGGLDRSLTPGDGIVVTSAMQYDIDATAVGLEPGCLGRTEGPWVYADSKLVNRLSGFLTTAAVVTGDTVLDLARWERVRSHIPDHVAAVDMETAAVGQVARANSIPWVAIRVISDVVPDQESVDFRSAVATASRKLNDTVLSVIRLAETIGSY